LYCCETIFHHDSLRSFAGLEKKQQKHYIYKSNKQNTMRNHRWILLFGFLSALFSQPVSCEDYDDEDEVAKDEDADADHVGLQGEDENDHTKDAWVSIWDNLGCSAVYTVGIRPIHSTSDWMRMRQAYVDVLKSSSRSQNITIPNPVVATSGYAVSVEARQAGYKGRGVFVVDKPVKKGQKVWSTVQTARFETGEDYRRFLQALPNSLSCDILENFSYVQANKNAADQTEKLYISADLDEGSLINSSADWTGEGIAHIPNLGCDKEMAKNDPGGCQENYYALRDIAVGEELSLDYAQFAVYDGWNSFDPYEGLLAEQ
jgi:hypothetical protein